MKDASIEYPMYFGAKPEIFKLARELRKRETPSEKVIWSYLSRNQLLGLQFRRQHPIYRFIADFYCPKIKLIIEIDGKIHDIPEHLDHDIERSDILNDLGITVIRFTNEQILNEIDSTIKHITQVCTRLLSGIS
jgi:very-short-patch-repair endonuclease